MTKKIEILLDGVEERIPEYSTISHVMKLFGENDKALLVAHNGRILHPQEYSTLVLSEGDRLEFINPSTGG